MAKLSFRLLCALLFTAQIALSGAQEAEPQCDPSCFYTDSTECVGGQCVCKDPTLRYYKSNYECALPVGSPCSTTADPATAAKCPVFVPCRANPGPAPDPAAPPPQAGEIDGICWNGLDRACDVGADCNPGQFLNCINGYCKCNNPLNHFGRDGACYARTWSKGCSSDGVASPKCDDPNAECFQEEVCQCRPGSVFINGICEPSTVGTTCRPYQCTNGLDCVNGTCQCSDPAGMVYDQVNRFCHVKFGERCDASDFWWRTDLCEANAQCLMDGKRKIKLCKCAQTQQFLADPDTGAMTCVPAM